MFMCVSCASKFDVSIIALNTFCAQDAHEGSQSTDCLTYICELNVYVLDMFFVCVKVFVNVDIFPHIGRTRGSHSTEYLT